MVLRGMRIQKRLRNYEAGVHGSMMTVYDNMTLEKTVRNKKQAVRK